MVRPQTWRSFRCMADHLAAKWTPVTPCCQGFQLQRNKKPASLKSPFTPNKASEVCPPHGLAEAEGSRLKSRHVASRKGSLLIKVILQDRDPPFQDRDAQEIALLVIKHTHLDTLPGWGWRYITYSEFAGTREGGILKELRTNLRPLNL